MRALDSVCIRLVGMAPKKRAQGQVTQLANVNAAKRAAHTAAVAAAAAEQLTPPMPPPPALLPTLAGAALAANVSTLHMHMHTHAAHSDDHSHGRCRASSGERRC